LGVVRAGRRVPGAAARSRRGPWLGLDVAGHASDVNAGAAPCKEAPPRPPESARRRPAAVASGAALLLPPPRAQGAVPLPALTVTGAGRAAPGHSRV
jgi:hypothetical protein